MCVYVFEFFFDLPQKYEILSYFNRDVSSFIESDKHLTMMIRNRKNIFFYREYIYDDIFKQWYFSCIHNLLWCLGIKETFIIEDSFMRICAFYK